MINRNTETKFRDIAIENTVPDIATPAFHHLTPLATGPDQEERIGNRVRLTSLQVFATFSNDSTTTQFHTRVIVYKRHGPFSNDSPLTAWWEVTNPNIVITHKDTMFLMGSRNGSDSMRNFSFSRRWPSGRGPLITWGNTTALGSQSGDWYMGVFSDQPGGTTDMSYTLRYRFWYKDA